MGRKTRALLRSFEREVEMISRANANKKMLNKLFSYKASFSRESISKICRICVFKVDFLENKIFCMKFLSFSTFICVTKSPQFRTTISDIFYIPSLCAYFSEHRFYERDRYILVALDVSRDVKIFIRYDVTFLLNRVPNLKTTHHNNNNIIRRSDYCVSLCSRLLRLALFAALREL